MSDQTARVQAENEASRAAERQRVQRQADQERAQLRAFYDQQRAARQQ